jgi:hypothetical protein
MLQAKTSRRQLLGSGAAALALVGSLPPSRPRRQTLLG